MYKLNSKKIMVVGLGGGFDVFTGLPIIYMNPECEFTLVNSANPANYFHYRIAQPPDPEGYITKDANISEIYTVGKHGCLSTRKAYEEIIKKHEIETILAVDGGIDSLSTGDEIDAGTILEDFVSLAALKNFPQRKILCCAGFGTETEENINHYRILENMSKLAKVGGFLASFSLTESPAFERYKTECEKAWKSNRKSHIQTKIISAVRGNFGHNNLYQDIDPRVANSTGITFVSLLSSIFWFFDLNSVIKQNKAIDLLEKSNTFIDAKLLWREFTEKNRRSHEVLPL